MLNLKKLLTKILQGDFIVEQGTDGIWEYRKWAKGTYEAWYAGPINVGVGTAMGGGYFHTSTAALTPPSFSQSVTSFWGANSGSVLFAYVGNAPDYKTHWWNGASAAQNSVPVRIDIRGTWR